ncbi:hypothetical protein GYA13_04180 [Candidatus Kuenenbacteria bacterium]|nr:hypothetical protein [Candidatus Kuenenbacteria bacterium]
MKLSALQKYILLECFNARNGRIFRGSLVDFYSQTAKPPKNELMVKIITKSIERLIKRDLAVGFGEITSERQFIKEIRITPEGRVVAKKLLGEQMRIPLKRPVSSRSSRGGQKAKLRLGKQQAN